MNTILGRTLAAAEALVLARLREVTLATLSEDLTRRHHPKEEA